jgi:predicted N-acyltransferase
MKINKTKIEKNKRKNIKWERKRINKPGISELFRVRKDFYKIYY